MQILVVDLGGQYTTLIGRSLRELGVRSLILPPQKSEKWIRAAVNRRVLKGIILSGGSASIRDLGPDDMAPSVFSAGLPVLGICLGMHLIAETFGGEVGSERERRGYGGEEMEILDPSDPLLRRIARGSGVWMSHGDSVLKIPPRFHCTARTPSCSCAAMNSDDGKIFGVQFHPEIIETEYGKEILSGFLDVCGAKADWQPTDIVLAVQDEIIKVVGPRDKALLAFSGGVDSSTLAAIAAPILGGRLVCLGMDHGGLRKNEDREIAENARAAGCGLGTSALSGQPIFHLDRCPVPFMESVATAGTDAEGKRNAFKEAYRHRLGTAIEEYGASVLLQGTLATDEIESGKKGASALIATHHNVGLPGLHPFRELFKYEVRDLARHLKLPPSISERKPFPGPGLYCRVVGQPVTEELIETVRWADAEVQAIVSEAGIEREFDQLVVALLCGQKVAGVKGDSRAYGYLIAVRAVQTSDFMTCRGYRFPPRPGNAAPVWKRIEKALVKHPLVVGVVPDETDKPPRRTEFE